MKLRLADRILTLALFMVVYGISGYKFYWFIWASNRIPAPILGV